MSTRTLLIEVRYKEGVRDPAGDGLLHDVKGLGATSISTIRSAQLYKITGDLSAKDGERAARDLLCDPVVQDFAAKAWSQPPKNSTPSKKAPAMVVDVWFKPGVTDVVGESVLKGLKDLNLTHVQDVHTGMRFTLLGAKRASEAERVAKVFLANPLIHECSIYAN